jgi:hypothetical protein
MRLPQYFLRSTTPAAENGKRGVIVGLVNTGSGTLKPVYIAQMVSTLKANNLLPNEGKDGNAKLDD